MLHTQTTGVSYPAADVPSALLVAPTTEAEAARIGNDVHVVARLRVCTTLSMLDVALACGSYAVTGGLGGLGLRAASLLVEGGACRVLLASRSGLVQRDGQDLDAQLHAMEHVATVMRCDNADGNDEASVLLQADSLTGMLHAAGVADKGLISELKAQRVHWVHASKAIGAQYLRSCTVAVPMENRVLFSSVGSGLGNVGVGSR